MCSKNNVRLFSELSAAEQLRILRGPQLNESQFKKRFKKVRREWLKKLDKINKEFIKK